MKKSLVVFYLSKFDEGIIIHRRYTSDGVEFDHWQIRKFSIEESDASLGRMVSEEMDKCGVEEFDYKYLLKNPIGATSYIDGSKAADEVEFNDSLTAEIVINKESKKYNFIGKALKTSIDSESSFAAIGAEVRRYLIKSLM